MFDSSVLKQLNRLDRPNKVKHSLSISDKLKVLEAVAEGKSERNIAKEFNISKNQVHNIKLRKSAIETLASSEITNRSAKILKNMSKFPDVDLAVFEWFRDLRKPKDGSKPLPVMALNIQERARREAALRGHENFKASDGWFRNWKKRFNIGNKIRLYGEAGDVNIEQDEPIIQELRE